MAVLATRANSGALRNEPWVEAINEDQTSHMPKDYTSINYFHLFIGYHIFFQIGGIAWKEWNSHMGKILKDAQRLDDDYAGSWDPNNHSWMDIGGRITSTAVAGISKYNYYYAYKSDNDD